MQIANSLAGFRTSNCCIRSSFFWLSIFYASTWSWLIIYLDIMLLDFITNLKLFLYFHCTVLCENCLCTQIYSLQTQFVVQVKQVMIHVSSGMQKVALVLRYGNIWFQTSSFVHCCVTAEAMNKKQVHSHPVWVYNLCHCQISSKIRCLFTLTEYWLFSHVFPDSLCLKLHKISLK